MFERRGDELYWLHYLVARFEPGIKPGLRNDIDCELGLIHQDADLHWPRIEARLDDIAQQLGYLSQLANRLDRANEEVLPDLIPLEASVVRLELSDHTGNVRHTFERLSNLLERLKGELFE